MDERTSASLPWQPSGGAASRIHVRVGRWSPALALVALCALLAPRTLPAQTITRTVTLSWTAPGNDGYSGTAASYSVRYATSPLSESSWGSAPSVSGLPVPLVAGSAQSVTASGFTPGITYYFGLKTVDAAGNWSALSNVVPVDMPPVAPFITAVSPNLLTAGTTTAVTLTGLDFQGPDSVWLQRAGIRRAATSVTTVSATQVTCNLAPAASDTGYWNVVIRNTDGRADTLLNGAYVRNTPPSGGAPTATSITPASGANTGSVGITSLAGTNFVATPAVWIYRNGESSVSATSVVVVSSSRITCTFNLSGLRPGGWDVYVRNPDFQTAILSGGFTVTGTAGPPAVASVAPSSGVQGQQLNGMVVSGSGFSGPDSVIFVSGAARRAATSVLTASSSQITCNLSLAGLPTGVYSATVRNADGQAGTLGSAFTVFATATPPVVTGFTPSTVYRGQDINGALISGGNFTAPDSVFLVSGSARVVGAAVTTLSTSLLRCNFSMSAAPTGVFDVVVKNPDGSSGTMVNALLVEDPPSGTGPSLVSVSPASGVATGSLTLTFHGSNLVATPMLRLTRAGRFSLTPTNVTLNSSSEAEGVFDLTGVSAGTWDAYVRNPSGLGFTLVGAFTVLAPPPVALSSTPSWAPRNTIVSLTLRGRAFSPPNAVRLAAGGVQVGATDVTTEGDSLIRAVVDLQGADLGAYSLLVANADGQADTLPGGFDVRRRRPVLATLGRSAAPTGTADAEIPLAGTALDEADTVYLARGTARIPASRSERTGDTLAVAHFDLRGAALGAWTVVAVNASGDSSAAAQGFVVQALPPHAFVSVTPASACEGESVTVEALTTGAARPESLWIARAGARLPGTAFTTDTSGGRWITRARFGLAGAAAGSWDVSLLDADTLLAVAPAAFRVDVPTFRAEDPVSRRLLARGATRQDTVRIFNTGNCPLGLAFASTAGWLTVAPEGATLEPGASVLLTLGLSALGRARGSYPGALTVSPLAGGGAPTSLPETLQVLEPRIQVAPTSLTAHVVAGRPAPSGTLLEVSNAGDATLHFSLGADVPWVSIAPSAGEVEPDQSAELSLTFSAASLAPGTHHGTLTILSDDSSHAGYSVPLTLVAEQPPVGSPYVVADSSAFRIALVNSSTASRRLRLYNEGSGLAAFTVRHAASWLGVAPDTGTVAVQQWDTLTVVVQAAELGSGSYRDTIEVRWGSDASRWIRVPVRLDLTRTEVSPLVCPGPVEASWVLATASLTWQPSPDVRVARYRVYRRAAGGAWTLAADSPSNVLRCLDPGLDTLKAYEYRVSPVDIRGAENVGCATASLAARPPGGPSTGLPAVAATLGYPNPFAAQLKVRVDVPASAGTSARVRVTVFDAGRREVAVLMDEVRGPGRALLEWDARNAQGTPVAPGLYRIRMDVNGEQVHSEWVARRWTP
ncbi:MAG: IPT/TIG domain-containing protein [Candidatus Eisenbacteria bacterium]|nr:IPT/TIG domain-containing protein [Candidatus Eisenbacteria bacterium]